MNKESLKNKVMLVEIKTTSVKNFKYDRFKEEFK